MPIFDNFPQSSTICVDRMKFRSENLAKCRRLRKIVTDYGNSRSGSPNSFSPCTSSRRFNFLNFHSGFLVKFLPSIRLASLPVTMLGNPRTSADLSQLNVNSSEVYL